MTLGQKRVAEGAFHGRRRRLAAWSVFNAPLSKELGVVAASAGDWPLQAVRAATIACLDGTAQLLLRGGARPCHRAWCRRPKWSGQALP